MIKRYGIYGAALMACLLLQSFDWSVIEASLSQAGLHGRVKLVIDSCYTAKGIFADRFLEEQYAGRSIDSYSRGGMLALHESYSIYGSSGGRYMAEYNSQHIITSSVYVDFDSSYTISAYDAKGHKTRSCTYSKRIDGKGIDSAVTVFKNNNKKNGYEQVAYAPDDNGKIAEQGRDRYNSSGELLESITGSGADAFKELYKYDKRHNLTEDLYYSPDGKRVKRTLYKYDGDGNETERADQYGDTILKTKTEYRLPDKQGNWHRRVLRGSDGGLEITERSIVYYEK